MRLNTPTIPLTPAFTGFRQELVHELKALPNFRFVDTAEGSTMAVNAKKGRSCELYDPRYEFPFPVFALYSVSRKSLFGRPKDFEQEGFALRIIDAITWLKGSIPDAWVNCNAVGPETSVSHLQALAQKLYPDGSPFLPE